VALLDGIYYIQVTWYIPHSDFSREPSLEFIYRKQRFYTFLALRDLNTNVYQILKTVAWMMELSIQVRRHSLRTAQWVGRLVGLPGAFTFRGWDRHAILPTLPRAIDPSLLLVHVCGTIYNFISVTLNYHFLSFAAVTGNICLAENRGA